MSIFSTIRLRAFAGDVEMQATDIKTSIVCQAMGVTVVEPGEAVIPLKGVTDLFKKAGSQEFTLQIDDGRAVMTSGKSRYRFATYPIGDFPKLPSSASAKLFCSLKISALIRAIDSGSLCASLGDEFPQYLSSALFKIDGGVMNVVSTDKRRLALAKHEADEIGESPESLLLPMKGLKELLRILGMLDADMAIRVLYDESQAYFVTEGMEFAIRRVESKFPAYLKILPASHRTRVLVDRSDLIASIDRVDVVVRDYNRIVVVNFQPDGDSTMSGRAPEFGEAVENVICEVEGDPILIGFNTRFFYDAVKILDDPAVALLFNGQEGHMLVRARDSDAFICLVAPVDIGGDAPQPIEDIAAEETAESGGDVL
jgi:DNA polymerase-3 subunit beta